MTLTNLQKNPCTILRDAEVNRLTRFCKEVYIEPTTTLSKGDVSSLPGKSRLRKLHGTQILIGVVMQGASDSLYIS